MTQHPRMTGDPTAIGIVSQIWGPVSDSELARAVEYQHAHPNKRLGEVMVECGILEPKMLAQCIAKQKELRTRPGAKDVNKILEYANLQIHKAGDMLLSVVKLIPKS
jgi:hypothetical protein